MDNKNETTANKEPSFLVHDSNGIHHWTGLKCNRTIVDTTQMAERPEQIIASHDCRYLAIVYKNHIEILSYSFDRLHRFEAERVKQATFSPKSTYLLLHQSPTPTRQVFTFQIFELTSGKLVHEWTTKTPPIQPFAWSVDETISHRMVGSDILFYENNNYEKCSRQMSVSKLGYYSFATNHAGCHYVALYVKGQKGAPAMVRVHNYPNKDNPIASKSFYKADSIEIKWNNKADALLILSSTDYDSSGKSYYGETTLHYLNLKNESNTITCKNEGTVSAAEWLPNDDGFLVIQGRTPSSVNWFNSRGDYLHSFGDIAVNTIKLNPFGNLVAFCGLGNLVGIILIWNLKTKKMISSYRALDTTLFTWLADGKHLITATHYERIRVENGFKLWNYLGQQLHQQDCREDSQIQLHRILSFNLKDEFSEPAIDPNIMGVTAEPEQRYVPPSLRSNGAGKKAQPRKPPPPKPPALSINKHSATPNETGGTINAKAAEKTKDPAEEKQKKLKNLRKKLRQIEDLKKLLSEGKELEKNQLEKIKNEERILAIIEVLSME